MKNQILIILILMSVLGARAESVNVCGTIDSEIIPEFVEAFTAAYGYPSKILTTGVNGEIITNDNPESPMAFTKRKIFRDYPIDVLNAYKADKARREVVIPKLTGEEIKL